jgi:hypothetical protein
LGYATARHVRDEGGNHQLDSKARTKSRFVVARLGP